MNASGDAAEQVVRFSLEGVEVAAKILGEGAKGMAILLVSALKQEQKTKGKARLTNMIKSGKELKVFTIKQKDLKKFTENAKKYGVLYTVLREKGNKDGNASVDIIARADDISKINRIMQRFEITNVGTASIISQAEKDIAEKMDKPMTIDELYDKLVGKKPTPKEKDVPVSNDSADVTEQDDEKKLSDTDSFHQRMENAHPLDNSLNTKEGQSADIKEKESVRKRLHDAKKTIDSQRKSKEKTLPIPDVDVSDALPKQKSTKER